MKKFVAMLLLSGFVAAGVIGCGSDTGKDKDKDKKPADTKKDDKKDGKAAPATGLLPGRSLDQSV
jgi:hypothetical protein